MRQHKDIAKAGTIEYFAVLFAAPDDDNGGVMPVVYKSPPFVSLDMAEHNATDALASYPDAVWAEVNEQVWGEAEVVDFDGEQILWTEDGDIEMVDCGQCEDGLIEWEKNQ